MSVLSSFPLLYKGVPKEGELTLLNCVTESFVKKISINGIQEDISNAFSLLRTEKL